MCGHRAYVVGFIQYICQINIKSHVCICTLYIHSCLCMSHRGCMYYSVRNSGENVHLACVKLGVYIAMHRSRSTCVCVCVCSSAYHQDIPGQWKLEYQPIVKDEYHLYQSPRRHRNLQSDWSRDKHTYSITPYRTSTTTITIMISYIQFTLYCVSWQRM